ncbi:MAG: DUF2779 domain-containing protein [Bacilli bacterium]
MAVTKTNFINYLRCPRYVALDHLKKEKLNSFVTLEDYLHEEETVKLEELIGQMYDADDNDIIDVTNEHLQVMLPYYNKVELLAGKLANKYFKGEFKYSKDTADQESFDCLIEGIRYLCYVDIYNKVDDHFNIIEVKATTSKKFLSIGKSYKDEFGNKKVNSIFALKDNIYYLREDIDDFDDVMSKKDYNKSKAKLFNCFDGAGKYVYDLAVQRYIIENDLRQNNMEDMIGKVHYYLAVLNCDYVFDGAMVGLEPDYHTDFLGNDIVCYFDLTNLTKDYMDKIDIDRQCVAKYIHNLQADICPIGEHCEYKKTTACKYIPVCFSFIPPCNSILNYIDNHYGFKDAIGNKYEKYDLLNDGVVNMLDVSEDKLNRPKNVIQRNVVASGIPYFNKDKIKAGIGCINYPIYHLDFETFPCPLPRFNGEHCYTQSVFQFSLHIESSPGVCDKESDHYEYLAVDHLDRREDLIKKMCEFIDVSSGGTILVYNESFEKTRLKELGNIFPIYQKKLNAMRDMIFDLMFVVKTNSKLYQALGYDEDEAKMFNYYHKDMNGSFSIKKILPLFSDLTYKGMDIGNGIEALITYANFPKLNKLDYAFKYQKLVEYCKQDTWAMVEILHGLNDSVKS